MHPIILLAVMDESRRQVYEEFLKTAQATYRTAQTLREVISLAAQYAHSGILLDMPIIVKATQVEKNRAEDTLRALPSAWANISKTSGEVIVLDMDAESGTQRSAAEFIRHCSTANPKIVHARNRVQLHLNALLSIYADMSSPVKTVCIDVSTGGCFLFSAEEKLVAKSSIWLQLIGLHDQTPIKGMICWQRPWGKSTNIPGIGISFAQMTSSQRAEISARIRQKA